MKKLESQSKLVKTLLDTPTLQLVNFYSSSHSQLTVSDRLCSFPSAIMNSQTLSIIIFMK